ncbi:MAG TPA: amino acid adenylation domain-containing protein, partial [Puia sp.]|nr:amino acid adenylation domain-containing protein [Puia sp.]
MKNKVSVIQKYIWLDQQISYGSPKYNIGGYAIIDGQINVDLFVKAANCLVANNDIFSFSFGQKSGIPVFEIRDKSIRKEEIYIEVADVDKAIQKIEEDFLIPFDVDKDENLCKIWLFKAGPDLYIWYAKLHHLIADGFSFQLLYNEVNRIYTGLLDGKEYVKEDSKAGVAYQNYIAYEQTYRSSNDFLDDEKFWLNKYKEFPSLIYAGNFGNDGGSNFNMEFTLSNKESEILAQAARDEKLSVFHLLLGALYVVFSKYYGKEEVNIGIPLLNRTSTGDKKLFGPLINLLPLRLTMANDTSFLAAAKRIKKELFASYRHQRFQQADILMKLPHGNNRLYDVRLSYERFSYQKDFAGHHAALKAMSNDSEDDPISIHVMDYEKGGLKFRFDMNGKYITKFEASQLIQSYLFLVKQTGAIMGRPLSGIQIANESQLAKGIANSQGEVIQRPFETFLNLWDRSQKEYGKTIAVIHENIGFSFKDINGQADKIAFTLNRLGVGKGNRIGVMFTRSEKSIAAVIAIFRLGAVYVPIDNEYPNSRKYFIIKDAELKYLLTDYSSGIGWKDIALDVDEILQKQASGRGGRSVKLSKEDAAYVIYTSGSTGVPKGVIVSHGSLYDYILTFIRYFKLNHTDRVLQQSSLSFDTSIEEIFPILGVGGTLVLANDPKDFHGLFKECERNSITTLSTNPFVIQYLNIHRLKYQLQIKTLISGGDVLKSEYVSSLINDLAIYNTYGPTESTVCATYYRVTREISPIPIGKPISNRDVFILDHQHILPPGATGEIGLSGLGLAKGYLNQPQLTEKAFVTIKGKRIYKTGDLGKWNENNELIFLGRKDHQLSYRGYRIEGGEIEKAIIALSDHISDCYASVENIGGHPALIAFIASDTDLIDTSSLTDALKDKLPSFMIPTHFSVVDHFPMLSNGKIDRQRLSGEIVVKSGKNIMLPSTPEENELAVIWEELLHLDQIDINSSFFEQGGHSLLANQFISIIRDQKNIEISLRSFYENPTIKNLAKLLVPNDNEVLKLLPAPDQELYPLSFSQERLWFLSQLDEESTAYLVPRAIRIKGELELNLIEGTFREIIRKHEILRTVFPVVEGIPYQRIFSTSDFGISRVYLSDLIGEQQKMAVDDYIRRQSRQKFNLEQGPLLRVSILQLSAQEHILILCEHHLILDGWTQGILLREFIQIYGCLQRDPHYRADIPLIQFKDYAFWQKKQLTGEVLEQLMNYWENKLKGSTPELSLMLDYKRQARTDKKGDKIVREVPAELATSLMKFSSGHNVTLFITMLAAFKMVLSKFSNETDICIGTGIANRRLKELDNVLGMVVNTLVLRTCFDKNDTLLEILDKVRTTCLESYIYEDAPFGKVVERVNPERRLGITPLFQYMFTFLDAPFEVADIAGLDVEIIEKHNESSKFDINVIVVTPFEGDKENGINGYRGISVEWEYNSDIFSSDSMDRMFAAYLKILDIFVKDHNQPFLSLNCISEAETTQLTLGFNNNDFPYPSDKTIIDLFVDQVTAGPDRLALRFGETMFTYGELDQLSNQLAHYLIWEHSIGMEDLVGITLDRSEWLVVSILAVLKAGGAYVPIPPDYPEERIAYLQSDARCKVTIDAVLLASFRQGRRYSLQRPAISLHPSALAYVIYTSGSTGRPKGVMIEHRSVVNYIAYQTSYFGIDDSENILQFSDYAFDASVEQLFLALFNGATLVLLPKEKLLDYNAFHEELQKYQVTHLHAVPNFLSTIDDWGRCTSLRRVIAGGEACPLELAKKVAPFADFYNKYGPTEATISATEYKYVGGGYKNDILPIGKPVGNTRIYVLSESGELQPIGVVGELYISGTGLARTYLNRETLTGEKFVQDPFVKGERMYRTGDLARWLPDGNLEYIGRTDNQVKFRGHRIELGEIEQSLLNYEGIRQAAVEVWESGGEKVIVAYVVAGDESEQRELDKQELKFHLGKTLPVYMLPSHYVQLDKLPLTPNGKIDRKALPAISESDVIRNEFVAARNEEEERLVEIWRQVLNVEKIGIRDNFFQLGGHSLKVTLLVNRIQRSLGYKVKVKDVFLYPTIAEMLSRFQKSGSQPIPVVQVKESYPLTATQRRLYILSQFDGGNVAYNIPGIFTLRGELDIEKLSEAFKKVIARHESLRTIFKTDGDEVRQYILPIQDIDFKLAVKDVSSHLVDDNLLRELIEKCYAYSFNLSQAPLLRIEVVKIASSGYLLLFNIHHVIGDGWSMEILSSEVITIYNGLRSGKKFLLPELPIQYKDYSEWLQSSEQQQALKEQKEYWLSVFKGDLPVLELPAFNTRPKIKTYNGSSVKHTFSKMLTAKIKAFSEGETATLFMTLLAGINGLFFRYTDSNDIILGTPVAGRSHSDLEDQIGLYLNTLAIRTRFDKKISFKKLVSIQKDVLTEAYSNQDYPFDSLIDSLNLQRDTSRSALFDVLVVLQNQRNSADAEKPLFEDAVLLPYTSVTRSSSQFDLSFYFSEEQQNLILQIEFNTDIYDDAFISGMIGHLEHFLQEGMERPWTAIEKINYLATEEKEKLLYAFNDSRAGFPEETIIDLFSAQVKRSPEAAAVLYEDNVLTYQELDELSSQLASYLSSNYGIVAEDLIGIKLERDHWLIIAILAVLKTGGAYVPLDPGYPIQRVEYIEQDCRTKVTIDAGLLEDFKSREKYPVALPGALITPGSLAYIIYTSGSTGKPKGVMIEHGNVTTMLRWAMKEFITTGFEVVYAATSHCFDLSVYEIFYPLSIGKRLRVIKSGLEIVDYLDSDKKILVNTVPSIVQSILEKEISLSNVVAINIAGEALSGALAGRLASSDLEVRNLYGPSEDTTYSTCFRLDGRYELGVPIGKPVSNTRVYILSACGELQPIGVVGELCISGAGLARGYLNQEALTQEKFVQDPFVSGERMYRTGDLARWLPDGNLEYIGRMDNQVKIRGHRIELGEIEQSLLLQEHIRQAVVDIRESSGEKTIVAYLVADQELDKQDLKSSLGTTLPVYMLPSHYIQLDQLPLTPNGKIDRNRLPGIGEPDMIRNEFMAPRNEVEKKLAAIWGEVLGAETIGIRDNFFELGGHSLKAVRLLNLIHKTFEVQLELKQLFIAPVLEQQARLIREAVKTAYESIVPVSAAESYAVSDGQRRLWVLSQFGEASVAYNMPFWLELTGSYDLESFTRAIEATIDRHE